jgi:hypothetical protein
MLERATGIRDLFGLRDSNLYGWTAEVMGSIKPCPRRPTTLHGRFPLSSRFARQFAHFLAPLSNPRPLPQLRHSAVSAAGILSDPLH